MKKEKTWTVLIAVRDGWPLTETERWSAKIAGRNSTEENWSKRSVNVPSEIIEKKPDRPLR